MPAAGPGWHGPDSSRCEPWPAPLGQRLGHVTLLMLAAALNQRMRSKHLNHRLVERFGPVDYDQ